jgi:hypothetical protein
VDPDADEHSSAQLIEKANQTNEQINCGLFLATGEAR